MPFAVVAIPFLTVRQRASLRRPDGRFRLFLVEKNAKLLRIRLEIGMLPAGRFIEKLRRHMQYEAAVPVQVLFFQESSES